MIQLFIDESGDLGKNNDYFIIAMVISHRPQRLKNLAKSFCAYHELDEVHAHELNLVQKQFLINTLTKQQDYSVGYIIADKMMIKNDNLFSSNNLLFNYLFSFLVRDIVKADTDDVYMYLDNRTQKVASLHSLVDYIKIMAYGEWGFSKKLNIEYVDSKICKTIQIADLVANCIRRKYRWGKDDFYSRLNIVKSVQFPYDTFRSSLKLPCG